MIKKWVLKPSEIMIMTFYRAQVQLYRQALRNLPEEHSALRNINVKIVDSMQGSEELFIIIDVVTSKPVGFLKLRNRVNVAFSRAMDGFAVIASILRESMRKSFHLSEVFSCMNLLNADTLVQTGSAQASQGIFSAYESQGQNCRFNARVQSPLHHYRCRHLENDGTS